ncbi:beta-ketoacyl-ACP synthase [Parahaliea mediterranea]|uniref:beta-ketoacyl-ACP synthase n=1 Tax=Parahaliea mediterranea TaxID=651086 RepID=UPI000E2F3FFE|nr:beta-ketoacyl-ACP synthase [Parahaliea mediterranea]
MYLNDLGLHCNIARTPAELGEQLLRADTPLPLAADCFRPIGPFQAGQISGELPALPAHLGRFDCRNNRLAGAVLEQVRDTLEPLLGSFGPRRIGVVMATSTSGIDATTSAVAAQRSGSNQPGFHACQGRIGGLGEFVAHYLGLQGPCYTLSTACSSSANALLSARRLLRLGLCDAVVTGGVDTLCQLTLQGFGALEAQSSGYCAPFTRERDGINIGEAGAVFILSTVPAPVALRGGACTSDAHHISAPHPQGLGAIAAMRQALADAGLTPADIDYLNLHGTGTAQNDLMEARAVHAVFADTLPCSSTKAYTGHCLGAASALELGLCYQLLRAAPDTVRLPPSAHLARRDGALAPIALSGQNERPERPVRHCMSNSFAFGGSNASLIIGSADD